MQRLRGLKQSRITLCLSVVFLLFSITAVRLGFLMLPESTRAAAENYSSISVDIAELRGTVYDRRMLPLTDCTDNYYATAIPDENAVISLSDAVSGNQLENALERLESGKPAVVNAAAPILSDSITNLRLPLRYSGMAQHIIGYTGDSGRGVSGIEKDFDEILYYGQKVKLRYSVSAAGDILPGVMPDIIIPETLQNGVVLTLDRGIQSVCESAANSIESGAIIVMEVSSGDIVAMVSRPDYNAYNVSQSLSGENSPLVNHALCAYSVGSVFKPLVAATALELGFDENTVFNCTGSLDIGERNFACHKKEGHGDLTLSSAVAQSCNCYFYNLSAVIGMENVLAVCEKAGLGEPIALSMSVAAEGSNLPKKEDLSAPAAAANFAIGQGALTLSPVHMAAIYNTVASGGILRSPRLIRGVIASGEFIENPLNSSKRIISAETAAKIQGYLLGTVASGTGSAAAPDTVSAAGKTATAQTGRTDSDGNEIDEAWFAGYFPAENPEYTVVILHENAISGAIDCAPVFKQIADGIAAQK